MENIDIYGLDDEHPIPNLDVVDVNAAKKDGGSDLYIVVATPLADDSRSLQRLLRKIERYLEFMNTKEFRAESGMSSVENTRIIVNIHPDSTPAAFELLERSKPWVRDNNADLVVDTRL
jgi:hypothetical protein